ncbi:hypothetical protein HYH02_008057 [Chlamydomonas schloesseri]|uniref:uracil phosphoribosyltransferase n=1 Tax=Chlamydomonas schloesseri TaxID=2026947 RepID=A0A836B3U2_9CHLO|nr:hypothetical protein HYH02_008057 [Chlamydomonas schloesseri]|eukprot:KAG2446901.1 hypothetical protein HYH02_008057 [Chlamydomonas schloesseri]
MQSLVAHRSTSGAVRRSAVAPARVPRLAVPVRASAEPAAPKPKPKAPQQMLVYSPPHPLIKHWLAILRSNFTPPPMFRSACAELGRLLIYEAMREFQPTMEQQVETPLGAIADATICDPDQPIKVVPILRAGLVLLEQAGQVLPFHQTYHVGYVRDPATLKVCVCVCAGACVAV